MWCLYTSLFFCEVAAFCWRDAFMSSLLCVWEQNCCVKLHVFFPTILAYIILPEWFYENSLMGSEIDTVHEGFLPTSLAFASGHLIFGQCILKQYFYCAHFFYLLGFYFVFHRILNPSSWAGLVQIRLQSCAPLCFRHFLATQNIYLSKFIIWSVRKERLGLKIESLDAIG